jgi:hypothetical protein
MILFAQADIGQLQAAFLKQTVIALFAFGVFISVVVSAIVMFLQYRMEKKSKEREDKRARETQPREIANQPVTVQLVQELHEQFASKKIFEDHVKNNTGRHSQLFNRIDEVERHARLAMDAKFTALNEERKETLEKLNAQFTYIRENIAAINRELQIKEKK